MSRSGSSQHEGEAGVVDLGVEVADTACKRVGAKGGNRFQARTASQMPVAGHRRVQAGEGVVEEKARSHVEPVPNPVLQREQKGRGVDQVRGNLLDEKAALVQGLPH